MTYKIMELEKNDLGLKSKYGPRILRSYLSRLLAIGVVTLISFFYSDNPIGVHWGVTGKNYPD